ncbi:MAG: molybdate ABC transporter permease subunit [Chloroflexi bacterium]|nr:molybdate ABC transporter permease subunit [Chloroflexota bacterium]
MNSDPLFPLFLSLRVAGMATLLALLIGIFLAWVIARSDLPGRDVLSALTALPLVLPPTVLGYYLLVALGQQSPLGRWLARHGMSLVFTWRGAVIAATVVALPLVVQSAQAALSAIDQDLEEVARTLGRSEPAVFFTVTLPLAWRGILAGAILAFARALGEFGATLMVAGNIPGRTQTMPIAIYDAVQGGNQSEANLLAGIVTVVAVGLLVVARRSTRYIPW